MKKENILITIGIALVVILIVVASLVKPEGKKKQVKENLLDINYDIETNETSLDKYETKNPVVAIYIKNYGSVVMELYPEIAPNTVNNFISLVKNGFYDNNTFHRLEKGFVLQGGDPTGTGTGGPGYTIKGEFESNDFENNLKHEKGVISMARSQDKDSAGSQFFIMLDSAPSLDGLYASFGKVIDGWDNIENIIENEQSDPAAMGKLRKNLTIKKAIIDLKGQEYSEVEKIDE